MKAKKILREIIITLAIILVSITAFIGFYLPNLNGVKDIIPEYLLGMELSKYRVFELVPNTGTRTINYDANGKEIPSDDKDTEVASSEEKPYNNPDVLNEENYKATKTVIENRIRAFFKNSSNSFTQDTEYEVAQNPENGSIMVKVPETTDIDSLVYELTDEGSFAIEDAESGELLLDNSDLKEVKAGYTASPYSKGYVVAISFVFNAKGSRKLEKISSSYLKESNEANEINSKAEESEEADNSITTESDGKTNTVEITAENQANQAELTAGQENNTETNNVEKAEESTENKEEKQEAKVRKISVKINGTEILSTTFDSPITNGQLQLTYGEDKTGSIIKSAREESIILSSGKLPVIYTYKEGENGDILYNKVIYSEITEGMIKIARYTFYGLILLLGLFAIIRYKKRGIAGALAFIGYIALLLIIVRVSNVRFALSGLIGLLVATFVEYAFILGALKHKEEKYKERMLNSLKFIIPTLLVSVIFAFTDWLAISSMGISIFWGLLLMLPYNNFLLKTMLKDYTTEKDDKKKKEEKIEKDNEEELEEKESEESEEETEESEKEKKEKEEEKTETKKENKKENKKEEKIESKKETTKKHKNKSNNNNKNNNKNKKNNIKKGDN